MDGVWKHGARKHNDERSLGSTSVYAHHLPPSTDTTGRRKTEPHDVREVRYVHEQRRSTSQSQVYVTDQLHQDTWAPLHTFVVVGPQQKHFQAVATETEREKRLSNREADKCESAVGSRNL